MCQQDDLARFQTDLAAHAQSINIIMAALQVVGGSYLCPMPLGDCWIFLRTVSRIKIVNTILNTNQSYQLSKRPHFNAWQSLLRWLLLPFRMFAFVYLRYLCIDENNSGVLQGQKFSQTQQGSCRFILEMNPQWLTTAGPQISEFFRSCAQSRISSLRFSARLRQQPAYMIDALGRSPCFYLEFIRSKEARWESL
jgi:hypothetical protein